MNENIAIFEARMMLPGQNKMTEPELFFTKQDAKDYLKSLFDSDPRFRMEGWVGNVQVSNEDVDFDPEYVFADNYMVPPRTNWQKEGF